MFNLGEWGFTHSRKQWDHIMVIVDTNHHRMPSFRASPGRSRVVKLYMDNAKLSCLRDEADGHASETAARFFVLSGKSGHWLIYREGVMNPIECYPGKLLTIENAKALAKLEAPSEVLVEQRNGAFKLQYSYAPAGKALLSQ